MMKNHHTLCLGLATLLVVPAVGSRGQDDLDLVGRLSRTIQAIEELAGIQRKLGTGDRSAVNSILAATEKATLEPEQRDAYLARLRNAGIPHHHYPLIVGRYIVLGMVAVAAIPYEREQRPWFP